MKRKTFGPYKYEYDPNKGRTDHALLLYPNILSLILRIKRALRAFHPKDLTISEILSVQKTGINFEPEEQNHYLNFLEHYGVAELLYRRNEFKQAVLSLHLAAEMFFKHLLVKLKYAYYRKHSTEIVFRTHRPFKEHQVNLIIGELELVSDQFRKMKEIADTKLRLGEFQSQLGPWDKVRYTDRAYKTSNCKNIYVGLRRDLKKSYKVLKTHGVIKWT